MLGKRLEPFKTAALGRMRTAAFFVLLAFGCGGVAFPLFGQTTEVGKSAPEAQSTNTSYVLIPNDLIRVVVYREPDLTAETRVDQDGTVTLHLIGPVKLGGKPISEANQKIKELYEKDFLRSAGVSVTLVQSARTNAVVAAKKDRITVSGQVKKPGVVELPEGQKVSLVEAIGLAGDFTNLANQEKVTVKRMVGGQEKVFTENVQAMMRDINAKPFLIIPGDVIVVKQTLF
ncbi:MAG: hypothetical protein EBS84_01130 [Proteobacteria bacterium]|nr:hypothetical protein [Verrucomicrobiota bacterium]NBU07611.1 hypothetical protein [Pseudomonadota bacterium]